MALVRKEQLQERPTITELYFDISGSDTIGNGTTNFPFLTPQKTRDFIKSTFTPSAILQFTVKALTAYNFPQIIDWSNSDWINLDARGCNFRINEIIIGGNNILTIDNLDRLSGIGHVIRKVGTGRSYLNVLKLQNTVSSGLIMMDNGELIINGDQVLAKSRTDTLITQDTGATGSKCIIRANKVQGKIFTVLINTEVAVYADYLDTDPSINAGINSILSGIVNRWKGNIATIGAIGNLKLLALQRESDPALDNYHSTAIMEITEGKSPSLSLYRSANFTIIGSTPVKISYDVEEETPYQITYSGGTATIQTNGIYLINAGYALDPSIIGTSREIHVYINASKTSTDTESPQQSTPVLSDKQNANITVLRRLKKGDTIEIYAWQNDASLTAYGTATYKDQTFLKIQKIGN